MSSLTNENGDNLENDSPISISSDQQQNSDQVEVQADNNQVKIEEKDEIENQMQQEEQKNENQEILVVEVNEKDTIKSLSDELSNLKKLYDDCLIEKNQHEASFESEIKRLKCLLEDKEKESQNLETKLSEVENNSKQTIDKMHTDFTSKLDQTFKKFQDSQKDKTSLVMKYAEAEKRCIDSNRANELLQSKLSDSLKEKQSCLEKLERVRLEKLKLNQDYEAKCGELKNARKDFEKVREEHVVLVAKYDLLQRNYKSEIEATAKSREENEKLKREIAELQAKNDASETEGNISENKSENSESPQKSEQNEHADSSYMKLMKEKLSLESKTKDLFEEMNTLKDKLSYYDDENKTLSVKFAKTNETLNEQKQMNKELLTEILQLREIQVVLTKEQQEKKVLIAKCDSLTGELNECNIELQNFHNKQAELLDFTSKLTEKNTMLQSENSDLFEKVQNLLNELGTLKNELQKAEESNKMSNHSLNEKLNEQLRLNKDLEEKLNKATQEVDELSVKLSDTENEIVSMKKKHVANIKDLTKQLQKMHKTVENGAGQKSTQDNSSLLVTSTSSTLRQISRNNSISSLDHEDLKSVNGSISSSESNLVVSQLASASNHSTQSQVNAMVTNNNYHIDLSNNQLQYNDVYVMDNDRQRIIDKIVKLQKQLARRNEKIEFLQDHVHQLTLDMQKKTKIIQAFAMKEDVGVFTSNAHDANKQEMARRKGIMASLYGTVFSGGTPNLMQNGQEMTMELCLEINSKLQALLEDTLIKNITLKDNIETLGKEIARLSQENRSIQMRL